MAIASMIGLVGGLVAQSGMLDSSYTQTKVEYENFGNFAQAGKKPGTVSGQTTTETEETITNTGISDALAMASSALPSLAEGFAGMDDALRGAGHTGPKHFYSEERKKNRTNPVYGADGTGTAKSVNQINNIAQWAFPD
jgi:hypothetical protein